MTCKDCELIAQAIRNAKNLEPYYDFTYRVGYACALERVVNNLQGVLKLDNPKFDGEHFREACGIESAK